MLADREVSAVVVDHDDLARTSRPLIRGASQAEAGRRRRRAWLSRYRLLSILLDGTLFFGSAMAAGQLRYSGHDLALGRMRCPYVVAALGLALLFTAVLASAGTYDRRVVGMGSEEYRRIMNGGVRFVAVFALIEVAFKLQVGRSVVLATIPGAVVLSMTGHYVMRRDLRRSQVKGKKRERLVVVGRERESASFIRHLSWWGATAFEVAGVFTGDDKPWTSAAVPAVERISGHDAFFALVQSGSIDSVAVVDPGALGEQGLRDLGWTLEGLGVDVMVAPEVTDVVGPRLAVRPVGGLPLVHVEEPRFSGLGRLMKDIVERSVALATLLVCAPLVLGVALAIKLTSPGPVLFKQIRVGRNGRNFLMLKFRSMRADADATRDQILHLNESDGLLFKVRQDPRITRIGRWIRRYSIDELPQLWNIIRGDMSIVGPRPPLPSEVDLYPEHVRRRLLVKPGLTGLWQVNGRADLSWEDSVRLDLHYVDNWSPTGDLVIVLRTLGAVLRGRGAY